MDHLQNVIAQLKKDSLRIRIHAWENLSTAKAELLADELEAGIVQAGWSVDHIGFYENEHGAKYFKAHCSGDPSLRDEVNEYVGSFASYTSGLSGYGTDHDFGFEEYLIFEV